MRALAERIGLYRVSALLIGVALAFEIVRVQAVSRGSAAGVACTVGELAFLALAAGVFVTARRARRRSH